MIPPEAPDLEVVPASRSPWRNLSLIWLVPLLALVVSLGIAWKNYSERGTLITITFPTVHGMVPGETTIKFRDVTIGTVEKVNFTDDLSRVAVSARIDSKVADTLPPDALFWIVKPEVSARGISGLSTVLSGVFVEGAWTPTRGTGATDFAGLDKAPLVRPGRQGTKLTLRSADGTLLPEGGPVIYHGVEVGQMGVPRISDDGRSAMVDAFIDAPNDRFLTTATRFWDTSGFAVRLGPAGFELSVAGLGALLSGGVAFDTAFSGGGPVTDATIFNVFADEDKARESIFARSAQNALDAAIVLTKSVHGLSAGSAVEYRGLRVGKVTGVGAFLEPTPGGNVARLRVNISVEPRALGLDSTADKATTLEFLKNAVADGMRARLATTSIFSAAMKIEFAEIPDASEDTIVIDQDGVPILPSVDSNLPNFTATAEGVMQRLNALPIEKLIEQAITLMASIEAVAAADGTRAVPEELIALLKEVRGIVGAKDTQELPTELREMVSDLRKVVATVQEQGAIERLATLLDSADKAAGGIAAASQDFPALVSDLHEVAQKAKALKAEELLASATRLIESAQDVIGTDSARTLPADLSAALSEVQGGVADLRKVVNDIKDQGAFDRLVTVLENADKAVADYALAAQRFPDLVGQLNDLAAKANSLKAEELVEATKKLMNSAQAVIGTDAAQALPAAISRSLAEVQDALAELREGGAVANVNATLASARQAADNVASAANDLPQLTAKLQELSNRADQAIAAYGAKSTFNAEILDVLREIQTTARAVTQLARTIDRNPNSLLIGR